MRNSSYLLYIIRPNEFPGLDICHKRSLIYHNYFTKLLSYCIFSKYIQVELKWLIPIIDQIIILFDYLFYYIINQKYRSNAFSHEYFETIDYFE